VTYVKYNTWPYSTSQQQLGHKVQINIQQQQDVMANVLDRQSMQPAQRSTKVVCTEQHADTAEAAAVDHYFPSLPKTFPLDLSVNTSKQTDRCFVMRPHLPVGGGMQMTVTVTVNTIDENNNRQCFYIIFQQQQHK